MGSLSKFFAENIDLLVDAFDLDEHANLVEKDHSRVAEVDRLVHRLFVTEMRGILNELVPPQQAIDDDEVHGYRRPASRPNVFQTPSMFTPPPQGQSGSPRATPSSPSQGPPIVTGNPPGQVTPNQAVAAPSGDGISSRFTMGAGGGKLNPLLVQTIHAASTYLPDGYRVSLTSGERPGAHVHGGGTSQHASGNAMDVNIIGPDGKVLPNRGEDTSGMYGRLARAAYHELSNSNPDMARNLRWGGNFETGVGSGVKDIMHYDLGGDKNPQGRFGNLGQQYQQYANTDNFRPPGQPIQTAQTTQAPKQQAIDYQPGNFAKTVGINPDQYNAFRNSIGKIENANYNQMGGSNNRFAGRYQMGGSEIAQTARQLGEPTPSTKDFLSDPQMQERYFERYSLGHHDYLMKNNPQYANASPEQKLQVLGYAHNQGAGGASNWLNTGQVGKDANGTRASKYSDLVGANLKQLAQNQPPTGDQRSGQPAQAPQSTTSMSSNSNRPAGILPIGDSLAYGLGKVSGNTKYTRGGADPRTVNDEFVNQAIKNGDVAGQHVVVSGGASNAGGDINKVNTYYPQMAQSLKNAGAASVTFMGVGPYQNYNKYGYHDAINKIAQDNGANYTGPLANIAPFRGSGVQQQVHPADYKPIMAHIQNNIIPSTQTAQAQQPSSSSSNQTAAAQPAQPQPTPQPMASAQPALNTGLSNSNPSSGNTSQPTPPAQKVASADQTTDQKPTQTENRKHVAVRLLRL